MFLFVKSTAILVFASLFGVIESQEVKSLCLSNIYRDVTAGVFDRNFENFDRVVRMANYITDLDEKVEVFIQLYDTMNSLQLLDNPLYEIPLFNALETLLERSKFSMLEHQEHAVLERCESLYFDIVNKSAEFLKAGVILHESNSPNAAIQPLLEKLYTSNKTLSKDTISTMVNRVRWLLPIEELMPVLRNLSMKHLRHNVDAMLALYNPQQFSSELNITYFVQLYEMTQDPEYAASMPFASQMKVREIMPTIMDQLLRGRVCMYKIINGTKFSLSKCQRSPNVCLFKYQNDFPNIYFSVKYQLNTLHFNFFSYGKRQPFLAITDFIDTYNSYFDLNTNVVLSSETTHKDWQLQLEGDQLVLKNVDNSMFLCAGVLPAIRDGEWYAYTRTAPSFAKHREECLWALDYCIIL